MHAENEIDELITQKITKKAAHNAYSKATEAFLSAFYLAITATIAFAFYITITKTSGDLAWAINILAAGLALSIGFLIVFIVNGKFQNRNSLTHTTKPSKRIPIKKILKNRVVVYFGNYVGTSLLILLIFFSGLYNADLGQWGLTALNIASHKLHYLFTEVAMLDNFIQNFASVEFGIAIEQDPSTFADISANNFIFYKLIPVTTGNIIGGGIIVGLIQWMAYLRPPQKIQQIYNSAIFYYLTNYKGKSL